MTNDGGGCGVGGGGAGGGRGPNKGRGGRGGGGGRGRGGRGGGDGGGGGGRPRSNSGGGPHHQQQQQRRRRPRSASHPSPSSSPSPSSPSSPPSQPLSSSPSSSRDASHLLNFRTAVPPPSSSSSSQKQRGGGDKKKKKRETPDQRRKRLQSERDERRHRQNLDSAFYLKSSSVHAFVLTDQRDGDSKPSGGGGVGGGGAVGQQQQPHDPDAVVKWDDVRTVRWLVSAHHGGGGDDNSTTRCPVCLDSHAAPRIVPCGHAFCYSCLLRHLYRDDRSSATTAASAVAAASAVGASHSQRTSSSSAAPKKCPCCAKPIDPTHDLRPVEFVTVVPPLLHRTMTFRKLHRIKHRPAPYVPTVDAKPRTSTLHPWPSASKEDVDGLYSRYQRFDVGTYRNHLVRDLSELRARAIELGGGGGGGGEEELFFIRMAGESVKSELRSIEASFPSSPAFDSVAASGEEGTSDNATAAKEQEVEGSRQSRQQKQSVKEDEAVPAEAHGRADKKKRSTSQQLPPLLHPNGGSRYLDGEHETQFYQAADGQCCFLSGFNVACLSAEFSVTVPPPPPLDGNDDAASASDVDRSAPPVASPVPQGSVEAKGGGDGAATQADDDDDDGAVRGKAEEEAAAAGSISEGGSLLIHTDEGTNNKNAVGDDDGDNANNNDDGQCAAAAAALRHRRRRPLPDTIEGRIVDVEIVHLTPEVRKRRPFLSHLPLYADVTFVELDINRILSDDVKIQFKNESDRRKKERKRRKDAEKKADRIARAKEEERIDELRKRIQRIDPNDDFFRNASGSFDEDEGDVVVGDDFGPGLGDVDGGGGGGGEGTRVGAGDGAASTATTSAAPGPPVVRPRRRSPPRDAVFSFNRVCATGGVWPGLGEGSATASTSTSSSPPTGGGVWGSAGRGEVGGVGGRGGGGGGPPVQWGRNDRNSEGPIPGPSMAHVDATKLTPLSPPSPSQLGKKKGKGKKVLLFSTGGQRGAGY